MEVNLDLDQKNAGVKFNLGRNCIPGEEGKGTPLFLSPDFVANAQHVNKEFHFPSFDLMTQMMSSDRLRSALVQGRGLRRPPSLEKMWSELHKAYRLEIGGHFKLANAIHEKFAAEYHVDDASLRSNLFHFLNEFLPLDEALFEEVRKIKEGNEKEFARFLLYYQTEHSKNHRRDFFEIASEYFAAYPDFSQILIYVRTDAKLPSNARATSVNFGNVNKFYASCYEFFASAICIYTCLNNIKSGRNFDELANVSLAKYLTTDKAKRRDSFQSNILFSAATAEYDSAIRNASFHNWFKLMDNKADIEYRSGGTGAVQTMTYVSYIYRCSILLKQLCNLLSVELLLDEIACNDALVTR